MHVEPTYRLGTERWQFAGRDKSAQHDGISKRVMLDGRLGKVVFASDSASVLDPKRQFDRRMDSEGADYLGSSR